MGTCQGRIFGVMRVEGTLNSLEYQQHVKGVCVPELKAGNGGTLEGTIISRQILYCSRISWGEGGVGEGGGVEKGAGSYVQVKRGNGNFFLNLNSRVFCVF